MAALEESQGPNSSSSQVLRAFSHGRLRLANRVAFMATVNNLGTEHVISDRQVAFYAERAKGGTGLIVTEGLSVHPTSVPTPTVPFAFDNAAIPGFKKLADAVHAENRPILGQLWHVGRNSLWSPFMMPWSASGQRDPLSGTTPHAMNDSEIQEVIAGYVQSALNLMEAGFDGVEVHGAHGYLLTQFLSPWSNKRDDKWGGSVENRSRIVVEIIRGIREACNYRFIIGLKMSVHEYVDGGLDLEQSQEIATHLLKMVPPDYFGVTQSNFSPSLERHTPDMRFPDAPFVELSKGLREVSDGIPVMAIAKIPDVEAADVLIAEGTADLIGMSRGLLADAHLVRKAQEGDAPRPCIYCNVCWDQVHQLRPISCIYGPETGREVEGAATLSRLPMSQRRTVRVIGAGPAGLELARVAATRGHHVHLYEAQPEAGGRLLRQAGIPGLEAYSKAVQWLLAQVVSAGVEVNCNCFVDQSKVMEWAKQDVVVQATGAIPEIEVMPVAENVMSLEQAVQDVRLLAGPVVIIDEIEDEPVYACAELLSDAGHSVRIVTRRLQIGRRVPYVNMIGVLRRLDQKNVKFHTLVVAIGIENGELIGRHVFSGSERGLGPVKTIVRAGPYQSTEHLDFGDRQWYCVGDAYSPRDLLAVVRHAHDVGRSIV